MQSNNPVFRRSEEFNRSGANAYGTQTYPGYGSDPSTWGVGSPGDPQGYGLAPTPTASGGRMTIDSVVQKTGVSIGLVVLAAMATWILTPSIETLPDGTVDTSGLGTLFAAATLGSLVAFGLSMVNSFKRVVSPGLVMAFAVAEGVALGGLSKVFNIVYPGGNVVQGAVIGTFAAFGGTLAAYKFLNIQVGDKFRRFVFAAVLGMVGLSLMELVLSLFGAQIGLFGVSGLGMLTAVAGLVLGVFMLILDFDFVEQGIRNGLPERESWTAAFAMTVSLVWIYTNLLRILAYFQQD
ncbi:Bax inhibitor-1/YccA family protein [Nocardioides sp. TRM66260-LWL]|uniref:Bax inhibitor-1/YccA family protein n=1 Tax=Nocardioides sp. TRM66260-LWL TaxID=2874478 RepID=UPI001CC4E137|nr:Bax inhibitor-1/YccA family protein [Nocardioides sp. TRM66260-LWL]MBZ5736096.1 Bax inhibitor-1/YccA family protein [Nocardioides sp. TRM66260-LWL]